jgi:hypothetical protein
MAYPSRDVALYYALRWISKRANQPVREEQLASGVCVELRPTIAGTARVLPIYLEEMYVWQDFVIISTGSESQSGHAVVIQTSLGDTKTFYWGKKL